MSISPKKFKTTLVDVQAELCEHWQNLFWNIVDVEEYGLEEFVCS